MLTLGVGWGGIGPPRLGWSDPGVESVAVSRPACQPHAAGRLEVGAEPHQAGFLQMAASRPAA
ncbi:hypothetical protein BVIET440_160144 [Burkholderia vietnamiensis]